MNDSILFLGKFNDNMLSLEEQILTLQNPQNLHQIKETEYPDVVKYQINGYESGAWVITGDVKPSLLLKDLILKTKIIIFVFDLSQSDSLEFLLEGWLPIIEKADKIIEFGQIRFLVGINSNTDINRDILLEDFREVMIKMDCKQYYEVCSNVESAKQEKIGDYPISHNFFDDIKCQLKDKEVNYSSYENIPQKTKSEIGNEKEEIVSNQLSVVYRLNRIDHTAEIIESPNAKGDIIIPSSINYNNDNYTVIQVCDNAFQNSSIISLSFVENSKVQRIGDFAFENSKLQKLFLPASLVELGKFWCGVAKNLSQIEVDKNNKFFVKTGEVLFYQDKNPNFPQTGILFVPRNWWGYFDVPKNITRIGSFAFYNCNKIQRLTYDRQMIDVGDYCFCGAIKLEFVTFICKDLFIGNFCFESCISLSSTSFENVNNAQIGMNSFEECNSLTSFTLNSTSNITIESYCFKDVMNLKSVNLSCNERLIIGNFCFLKCSSLELISFQKSSYLKIGRNCFDGCEKLEKLNLSNVKTIELEELCFSGMKNFKDFYFQSDTIIFHGHLFNEIQSIISISIVNNNDLTIPSTTFDNCKNIKCITLVTKSILTISKDNFNQLPFITNIVLSGNIIIIEDNCFNECMNSAVNENSYFFSRMINIQSTSFVEIGNNCFNKMIDLGLIEIAGTIVNIGNYCFNECYKMSTITFTDVSFVEIESGSFVGCENITKLNIKPSKNTSATKCFEIFKQIENGKYFCTFIAQKSKQSDQFFIDCYNQRVISNEIQISFFKRMTQLNCNNNYSGILPFIGFGFMTFNRLCIPSIFRKNSPYYQLWPFVRKETKNSLSNPQKYIILLGITHGIKFLHSLKISIPYLTLDNILIDDYYLPYIFDYRIFIEANNDPKTLINDIYSYLLIAYELITEKAVIQENFATNIQYYLDLIKNPKIQELFRRIWLFGSEFIPPIYDIYEEIKNEQYKKFFLSADQDISEYFSFFEKLDCMIKDEDIQNVEITKEQEIFVTNKDGIILKLLNNNRTAEIVSSKQAKGNIFIPKYCEFRSIKYEITRIHKSALSGSKIKSLSFSLNSKVERIDDFAFNDSSIQSLYIPSSLVEISKSWIGGTENLSKIEIDQNSTHFIKEDDILYYIDQSQNQNPTKEILFIPRNKAGCIQIKPDTTHIRSYAFYKCQIQSIISNSDSIEVDPYSFNQCNYLESITLQLSSHCYISNLSIYGLNCLQSLGITCNDLTLSENWIKRCSSLEIIVFNIASDFIIGIHTFSEIKSILGVSVTSKSSLTISTRSFVGLPELKSIQLKGNKLAFDRGWIYNCPNLRLIVVESNETFAITPDSFSNLNLIETLKFTSSASLFLMENLFYFSYINNPNKLKNVELNAKDIIIGKFCFNALKELQSVQIRCNNLIIGNNCFYNCSLIESILFENIESMTLYSNIFTNCPNLKEINLSATTKITLLKNCFNNSQYIQSITFNSKEVSIGDSCFINCRGLSLIQFKNVETLSIGSNSFQGHLKIRYIVIESSSVIDIKDFCFNKSFNLQSVTLKSSVVNIGNNCFEDCHNLNYISFKGVKNAMIGSHAFNRCVSLSIIEIRISSDLTICNNCFSGARNLQSVTICCDGLTLGDFIFSDCYYLYSVIIRNKKNYIVSKKAFHNLKHQIYLDFQTL